MKGIKIGILVMGFMFIFLGISFGSVQLAKNDTYDFNGEMVDYSESYAIYKGKILIDKDGYDALKLELAKPEVKIVSVDVLNNSDAILISYEVHSPLDYDMPVIEHTDDSLSIHQHLGFIFWLAALSCVFWWCIWYTFIN